MTVAAVATRRRPARLGYVLKVFPRVSETFVINEIRALEALGESVCVLSLHHGTDTVPHAVLRELRAPVVYVDEALPPEDVVGSVRRRLQHDLRVSDAAAGDLLPRKYVRLAIALAEAARAGGVGCLHAHFASRSGHVAALAAHLLGCRFTLTAHAKDIYHRDVTPAVLRWKLARAARVVTVTDFNHRYLSELMIRVPGGPTRLVRLYNGVDLARFVATPYPAAVPPLVLGVGRLVEKKGFGVLVEACRLLRARGVALRLSIIGGGPEEAALRAQLAGAGLDGVAALRGVLPTEAVAMALREAAVVALPCVVASDGNVDALPTVLLEAMATARPVVSTRLSGIPEIVLDGETGRLVPPCDAASLADALAELLGDPARAAAMGRAGRRRAEALFDLHANAQRLREWLHEEDRIG